MYDKAAEVAVSASARRGAGVGAGMVRRTHYVVEAFDPQGNLKWADEFDNLVVTAGLNDSLTQHFKGVAYTASWWVGLTDGTPTFDAGDTMGAHAGWVEVTAYAGNRKALTLGAVAGGSVDNSAAKATFTINANGTTIGGAFINTAETGAAGTLYGGGAFAAGDKVLDSGDTLSVTVTLTAAAA